MSDFFFFLRSHATDIILGSTRVKDQICEHIFAWRIYLCIRSSLPSITTFSCDLFQMLSFYCETGSLYVAFAVLELFMQSRLAINSQTFACIRLLRGLKGCANMSVYPNPAVNVALITRHGSQMSEEQRNQIPYCRDKGMNKLFPFNFFL